MDDPKKGRAFLGPNTFLRRDTERKREMTGEVKREKGMGGRAEQTVAYRRSSRRKDR